uniref:Retrovirus-related Pol polyprotein from transposon TNT 1-94-like beta-barrel domain-containing protein n=1 Tax=Timema bartmani TaxID=61472 RepID=A0A7R9F5T4_9NEOP|nr:unnamed protein product [Timema bartmani]
MEIILHVEKIINIINGNKEKTATTEVEEVKTWNDGNEKGMLIISTGLEYSHLQTVIACETAAQMWNHLNNVHEQRSSVNKVSLKQQLFSYRMIPNDSIAQHISTIESMALSSVDVGEVVSDVDNIAKTLESLPTSFSAFISSWNSYAEVMQTFENLTREEKRLMQNDDVTTAFAALNVPHAEYKNVSASGCETVWLADTAASKHMAYHKEWFSVLNPIDSLSVVKIRDNSYVQAEGIGSVELLALNDEPKEQEVKESVTTSENNTKQGAEDGASRCSAMSELQATVEFCVELYKFYNVDLFQRGLGDVLGIYRCNNNILHCFTNNGPRLGDVLSISRRNNNILHCFTNNGARLGDVLSTSRRSNNILHYFTNNGPRLGDVLSTSRCNNNILHYFTNNGPRLGDVLGVINNILHCFTNNGPRLGDVLGISRRSNNILHCFTNNGPRLGDVLGISRRSNNILHCFTNNGPRLGDVLGISRRSNNILHCFTNNGPRLGVGKRYLKGTRLVAFSDDLIVVEGQVRRQLETRYLKVQMPGVKR